MSRDGDNGWDSAELQRCSHHYTDNTQSYSGVAQKRKPGVEESSGTNGREYVRKERVNYFSGTHLKYPFQQHDRILVQDF